MVLRWGFRILLTATLLVAGYIALFDPPPPVEVPRLPRTVGRFEPDCARSEFVDLILSGQHFRFARHDLGPASPVAGRKDDILYQEQVRYLCDPGGGLPVHMVSVMPRSKPNTYKIDYKTLDPSVIDERGVLIHIHASAFGPVLHGDDFKKEVDRIFLANRSIFPELSCSEKQCIGRRIGIPEGSKFNQTSITYLFILNYKSEQRIINVFCTYSDFDKYTICHSILRYNYKITTSLFFSIDISRGGPEGSVLWGIFSDKINRAFGFIESGLGKSNNGIEDPR